MAARWTGTYVSHPSPFPFLCLSYLSYLHSVNIYKTNAPHRQGQANHFLRFAKEKIPYGIQRYVGESERLYGILDARLKDRDYVAGPGRGKYSIADISILGWANIALLSGIDIDSLFPNIVAWLDRCLSRPATKQGFSIPNVSSLSNEALRNKIKTDPEEKRKDDEIKKLLADAKAQYNYKYSSP